MKTTLLEAYNHIYTSLLELKDSLGRQVAELFIDVPDKNEYPDYYQIIQNVVSLNSIKEKLSKMEYLSWDVVKKDFQLMIDNAKLYNRKGTQVYQDALTLNKHFAELSKPYDAIFPSFVTQRKEIFLNIWKTIFEYTDSKGRLLSELFEDLPSKKEYPDYYEEIATPVSLNLIKKRIVQPEYSLNELEQDFETLFSNAKQYNMPGSQVYKDAVTLNNLFNKLVEEKCKGMKTEIELSIKHIEVVTKNGVKYKVGDFVYILNPLNPKNPIVGQIHGLFIKSGVKMIKACWFLHQDQTRHPASRKFYEKEVFKSSQIEEHPFADVQGKCCVLFIKDFIRGKPHGFKPKDIWVCESRYHDKQFFKIKNWSTCLPESVRNVEVDLENFSAPLSLKKVPSIFLKEEDSKASPDVNSLTDSERPSAKKVKLMGPRPVDDGESMTSGSLSISRRKSSISMDSHKSLSSVGPILNQAVVDNYPLPPDLSLLDLVSPVSKELLQAYPGITHLHSNTVLPERTAEYFETTTDKKVLWFAGPPQNIIPDVEAHTLDYLCFKHLREIQAKNLKEPLKEKETEDISERSLNVSESPSQVFSEYANLLTLQAAQMRSMLDTTEANVSVKKKGRK